MRIVTEFVVNGKISAACAIGCSMRSSRFISVSSNSPYCKMSIAQAEQGLGVEQAEVFARELRINPTVTRLSWETNIIGNNAAKVVAEALQLHSSIRILSMTRKLVGDEGAVAIASALNVNTTLVELELSGNVIGDAGATALADTLKRNTSLQRLSLGSMLGDEGVAAIAHALKLNTTVDHLDLEGRFGDRGTKAMAEALKVNKTLTFLTLNGRIRDEGAIAIADSLKVNSTLQHLHLLNTVITNRGGRALLKMVKATRFTTRYNYTLSTLRLHSSKISSHLRQAVERAVDTKYNQKRCDRDARYTTRMFIHVCSRVPYLDPQRE
jgi:Leucine Rich repeat